MYIKKKKRNKTSIHSFISYPPLYDEKIWPSQGLHQVAQAKGASGCYLNFAVSFHKKKKRGTCPMVVPQCITITKTTFWKYRIHIFDLPIKCSKEISCIKAKGFNLIDRKKIKQIWHTMGCQFFLKRVCTRGFISSWDVSKVVNHKHDEDLSDYSPKIS